MCVCARAPALARPIGWLSAEFPTELLWVGLIFTVNTGVALHVVMSQVIWLVTCSMGTRFITLFVAADLFLIWFVYYFFPESVVSSGTEDV
ncbi:hypothetical protein FRX31_009116 [Thalictrum thalictroides]|uniref:Uncharacterized protein n=1 Tax=Thalictrum thalictroides TaxID=46969 RepID=A0A7J6WV49_THATH|nr:hypothetical protein FRX31_009116 [Thalictrum thalictroides]